MIITLSLLLVTLGAAALSALLIVLLHPVFVRHALARPNVRSSHRVPTPQGGGVAVIAAAVSVTFVAVFVTGIDLSNQLAIVLAAAAALAVVGWIDDVRSLETLPRLLLQAVAVAAVLATLPDTLRIVPVLPWWLERALLLVGGLWFVNLVNFMDGIDWMTAAQFVPATAALAFVAPSTMPPYGAVVAAALLGAMLGFAPFNKPVARLFLGDVGSLPLGLLLGWLLVLLAGAGHVAAAILLPLYYLADTAITLARRIAAGEPITQAHRSHYYQRAVDRGWSVLQVVARVFGVNVVLATLAIITIIMNTTTISVAAVAGGAAAVALLLRTLSSKPR